MNISQISSNHLKIPIFIVFIALMICAIWFSPKYQLAAGEEGFSVFNHSNIISLNGVWNEVGGGLANGIYLPRIPLSLFVSLLSQLGIEMWLIQGTVFFLLITTGMISMFYLTKHLFKDKESREMISLFAALFYFFNLFSMSQIWSRFLYSHIFLWSYLPFFLFIWIILNEKLSFKRILLFLGSSLVFSLTYLQPANVITLWVPAGIWTLVNIYKTKSKTQRLNMVYKSVFIILIWLVFNLWWIYPYIKLAGITFSEIANPRTNINNLISVSQYFPSEQIALLRQNFIFGKTGRYFDFYSQPWVYSVSILALIVVAIGWWKTKKEKVWLYLTVLLIVGWFISKGVNPPFGNFFYQWLFDSFPVLGFYRNSYEKFGVNFLLTYSIFFGIGIVWIQSKILMFWRVPFLILSLFILFGVLVWPLWSGFVVENKYVKLPSGYIEMNQWLNDQSGDKRLFHIPATPGHSMTYDWGFDGIEPSEFLFDRPSITRILSNKLYDAKYAVLLNNFNENKDYISNLNEFNVGYIVLHKDITDKYKWSNATQARSIVESNPAIKLVKENKELAIYKIDFDEKGLFEVIDASISQINYQKISPAKYKIFIDNPEGKIHTLVFKSTFSELWQARINGQTINDHFVVYDYANGWKIDKKGKFEVEVVFKVWPWE